MTKSKTAPQARTTKYLSHEFSPGETNWAAVAFPTDAYGLTNNLRREFYDTIVRCRGSNETFEHVLDTLEVLMAWAQTRLEADRAEIASKVADAAARSAEEDRKEAFRVRIQAGETISVMATATGFLEQSPRNGATYDTADDARGPVAAMACMMLAEGREPSSVLRINAFGRPGIGSGQTVGQLAGTAADITAPAPPASGGLIAIRV